MNAASQPLIPAAAAADDAGGDHHKPSSSLDVKTLSWTSAEVMSWLERSQLQHLRDWYVTCYRTSIKLSTGI